MSELPNGWRELPLGEVADVQLGKMLSAKSRSGKGARPYLRNINIRWGRIEIDDVLEMDFDSREVEKYRLREGDVLVCEGGEPGRAAVWREQMPGALYQKALHRVRFRERCLEPALFVYQLELDASTGRLSEWFTGTTIKHLPRESFLEYRVRVPPLQEQARVLAALEEHLSDLDAANAAIARAAQRAVQLRSSLLRQALDGGLPG